MEQRRGRTASLGSLLTGVGMLGVAAGTVVLIAYDFHRALQTWILETIEYSQRLAAMPGAIADVEIQVMALLALGGGIALLFAGLAVRAHAKAQLASERRTPAGAGAESPRVA